MSMVELLVLGLISESPRHGYEIIKEFKSRRYDQWSRISEVSVYKALERLASRGMIDPLQEIESRSIDRRPYQITQSGIEHLSDLVFRYLSSEEPLYQDYFLPIQFIEALPCEEACLALERRLSFLYRKSSALSTLLQATADLAEKPQRLLLEHLRQCYEREIAWLKEFAALILKQGDQNEQKSL